MNLRQYLRSEVIHQSPHLAEPAAQIIATQWNHKQYEIDRNMRSMVQESRDALPCHLALVLKIPTDISVDFKQQVTKRHPGQKFDEDVVVGHVKLAKADGRSDGACCISYSLVVEDKYRGFGFGRALTEYAEHCALSLGLSYMYLSTNDKVAFYEHLGYNQCEAVSSLGSNSKHLNASQVSALEGLFAKRLNVCNPADCNTWLRKRLIDEYPMQGPLKDETFLPILGKKMLDFYGEPDFPVALNYAVYHLPMYSQQQTGPSCGISAMNIMKSCVGVLKNIPNCPSLCFECAPDARLDEQTGDIGKRSALRVAIVSNVSRDGELFCARNFASIAAKALNLFTVVMEDWSVAGILSELLAGYPVVVPYDRDVSNHKPGKSSGSQAHWCVIVGVVFTTVDSKEVVTSGGFYQISFPDNNDVKLHLITDPKVFKVEFCNRQVDETTIFVCLHGMSKTPFLCSFKSLRDSNAQLMTCKTKHYVAPADLVHLRGV